LIQYEKKCAIITKDLKNLKINARNIKDNINTEFFNNAEQLSKDILDCIKRGEKIICIPLSLRFAKKGSGHANMLFFRPEEKIIERFEPHGEKVRAGNDKDDENINTILKKMFEVVMKPYLKEYTPRYKPPSEICPGKRGFQSLENEIESLKKEGGGFCNMWSLFIMELLFLNPTKTTEEVYKIAFEITKEDPQYIKDVIRGYVVKAEKQLDEYIKKIDSKGGFQYIKGDDISKYKPKIQEQLLNLLISFGGENSQVGELKELLSLNKKKEDKYEKLKTLLQTKTKIQINDMMISIKKTRFKKTDLNKQSLDFFIDIIINLIEKDLIKEEKIFDYFGVKKGAGFKICPKTGKCLKVSKCGGVRV